MFSWSPLEGCVLHSSNLLSFAENNFILECLQVKKWHKSTKAGWRGDEVMCSEFNTSW